MYDLPLMQIINRLKGIKKNFQNIAFIGPNPYLFLKHMGYENVQKFTFVEHSEKQVQKSLEIIEGMVERGMGNQPEEIEPLVICDETEWPQEMEQYDLIVSNMQLHWHNDVERSL